LAASSWPARQSIGEEHFIASKTALALANVFTA
jgi:hypothetical protein